MDAVNNVGIADHATIEIGRHVGDIRRCTEIHEDLVRAFVNAEFGLDIGEALFMKGHDEIGTVLQRIGGHEIIIGQIEIGIVEFVSRRQVRINGGAAVDNTGLDTEKSFHDIDDLAGLRVGCGESLLIICGFGGSRFGECDKGLF